jgi:hypothetical protein
MATNYANKVSNIDAPILKAAIAILVNVLTPYRSDVVIKKKILWFSAELTVGDVLDFLTRTFG